VIIRDAPNHGLAVGAWGRSPFFVLAPPAPFRPALRRAADHHRSQSRSHMLEAKVFEMIRDVVFRPKSGTRPKSGPADSRPAYGDGLVSMARQPDWVAT
jgi:hypothetical protein